MANGPSTSGSTTTTSPSSGTGDYRPYRIQAQGARDDSESWTQVMDLLTGDQRFGQSELIRQMLIDLTNIRGRQQEPYAGISEEGARYRTQLKDILQSNTDLFRGMADTQYEGVSPEFKAMLSSTVDAPTMEAAGILGKGLGIEGGGGGHYSNRQSSNLHEGNLNIADAALKNIVSGRTEAMVGERQRGEQQAFNRRMGGLQGLQQTGQSLVGLQEQERAILNEGSMYRQAQQQNQLNAILAMMGLGSQLTSAVGSGLGRFSTGKSESGGGGLYG